MQDFDQPITSGSAPIDIDIVDQRVARAVMRHMFASRHVRLDAVREDPAAGEMDGLWRLSAIDDRNGSRWVIRDHSRYNAVCELVDQMTLAAT